MNNIAYYNLFGLIIKSSLDLKYLKVINYTPDKVQATFEIGDIETIEADVAITSRIVENDGFRITFNKDLFLLDVYKKFAFSIKNRSQVRLQLNGGTTEDALPYFYGTVITALLHFYFKFPIHCSASLGKNGLNLFCAVSGTGKSTLAIRLHEKGYPIFADDKCVLQWNPILKSFTVQPSIRAIRLCEDAIANVEDKTILKEPVPIRAKEGKFQFNLDNTLEGKINLVSKIFVIKKNEDIENIRFRELKGKRKLNALYKQLHRPGLIAGDEMKDRLTKYLQRLATKVQVFLVVRPTNLTIGEFTDFMISKIEE